MILIIIMVMKTVGLLYYLIFRILLYIQVIWHVLLIYIHTIFAYISIYVYIHLTHLVVFVTRASLNSVAGGSSLVRHQRQVLSSAPEACIFSVLEPTLISSAGARSSTGSRLFC